MKINTRANMSIMFATLLAVGLGSQALAYYPIQTQLDFGETNADVTNLQTFFKDNASIYPEGIVSGYFGSLTRAAVQRFQTQKGIISYGSAATTGYGRVGPSTRDEVNSLIDAGGWVQRDMSGPAITGVSRMISNSSVTLTWNTNELATAKVFYYTSPVTMNEGDINSVGFGSTNGWTSISDNVARTSSQVIVSGLTPNTKYYYVIVSTDAQGNVSLWNPNTSFVTTN